MAARPASVTASRLARPSSWSARRSSSPRPTSAVTCRLTVDRSECTLAASALARIGPSDCHRVQQQVGGRLDVVARGGKQPGLGPAHRALQIDKRFRHRGHGFLVTAGLPARPASACAGGDVALVLSAIACRP